MKKVLSCLLVVLLLASLSVSAFATASVQNQPAPVLAPAVPAEDEDTVEISSAVDANGNDISDLIKITSDMDAEDLPDEALAVYKVAKAALEDNLEGVIEETEGLADVIDGRKVAVSDLFDISVEGEVEFPITIKLKIANPDIFVALLHYVDGAFQLVETELEGDILTFTVDSLSPFAIISLAE